jgi:hypothetical protein
MFSIFCGIALQHYMHDIYKSVNIYTTRQKLNNTGFFIQEYFFTEFINNHKIDQINWICVFTQMKQRNVILKSEFSRKKININLNDWLNVFPIFIFRHIGTMYYVFRGSFGSGGDLTCCHRQNITRKTKNWATRTPLKDGGELMCFSLCLTRT